MGKQMRTGLAGALEHSVGWVPMVMVLTHLSVSSIHGMSPTYITYTAKYLGIIRGLMSTDWRAHDLGKERIPVSRYNAIKQLIFTGNVGSAQ